MEDLKEAWGEDVFETALEGLSVIDAPAPAEEARAIALMLRETLETPGARGILVTPDRNLSRRVITEMARFASRWTIPPVSPCLTRRRALS